MTIPFPEDETERLAALLQYEVLDTEAEQLLDDLTQLAAQICGVPISLISLIDEDRQWFKSRVGLDAEETPREHAFCAYAIMDEELFVVPDATEDARFAQNPLVTGDPDIRFYAGMPLQTPAGYKLGTLCVIDRQPRQLTVDQEAALKKISRQVMAHLETRLQNKALVEKTAALHRSESMFRSLLKTASVGVVIVKENGRIHLINERATQIFGYSNAELIDHPLEILLPEHFREQHQQHQKNYLANPRHREMGTGLRLVGQHKSGRQFPIEVSLSHARIEDELLVMAFVLDVSRRQRAEEDLRRRTAELSRSNEELEQFAYVISHDLRAPLRAMYTYSQFLQEDNAAQLDEDGLEYLEGIQESALQMEKLVLGLLEYSRVGRERQARTAVDIGDMLESIIKRNQLDDKAEIQLPPQLPTIVMPPVRVEQIFANLLNNAVKFRRPEETPVVVISCKETPVGWEFSIRDNGIGIAESQQEKIFGVFQRLHTQDQYEGTGIGLAIVKKAVQEQGGDISVWSVVGKGTTFTFTLANLTEE